MTFDAHIGIDYSGAGTPDTRLRALRVFVAGPGAVPVRHTPGKPNVVNWTRREIHGFCEGAIAGSQRVIIGIDHAFAFPVCYSRRHNIPNWDAFLDHLVHHWPTTSETIESCRDRNPPGGDPSELRLCEKWTSGAKSVFRFDFNGSVAHSTRAGIPWLRCLRRSPCMRDRVHWWPFDGFDVPDGKSVVAEVYPSLFRNRYPCEARTADEQDAYATAKWLAEMDERLLLPRYFHPPLTPQQSDRARRLEGWILGVT